MAENKKLALIRILQILEKNTDDEHSLTQDEIARILSRDYGIEIERKAVGRDVATLVEAGFDIEVGRGGTKLVERKFDDTELRLLIDSVLSSRHITKKQSVSLIERLSSLSSKYFKMHIKHIHSVGDWFKTENNDLFFNIQKIDEAIEMRKTIEYDYNKYGKDKKLNKKSHHNSTPYQLVQRNQKYYLMCYVEEYGKMAFHRLDKMTGIQISDTKPMPLRRVPGYENGINYKDLSTALPYMFSDKPENIDFYAKEWMTDPIIDWFGKDVSFLDDNGRMRVLLRASPDAMLYWALQYSDSVEIIAPAELRERVKDTLKSALETYGD